MFFFYYYYFLLSKSFLTKILNLIFSRHFLLRAKCYPNQKTSFSSYKIVVGSNFINIFKSCQNRLKLIFTLLRHCGSFRSVVCNPPSQKPFSSPVYRSINLQKCTQCRGVLEIFDVPDVFNESVHHIVNFTSIIRVVSKLMKNEKVYLKKSCFFFLFLLQVIFFLFYEANLFVYYYLFKSLKNLRKKLLLKHNFQV